MIPALDAFGHLPAGGHHCTWPEFYERFQTNDRRRDICKKLDGILALARQCGFLKVLVGGSFPTAEEQPDDMDLTWIVDKDVSKDTVKPECVKLMDDRIAADEFSGWSMLYLPLNHDEVEIQFWAHKLGFCAKTKRDRGTLVLDL